MDTKQFILIIIGIVLLIGMFIGVFLLGRASREIPVAQVDSVKVVDTLEVPADPVIKKDTQYVFVFRDTTNKTITIKDSISGYQNMARYNIKYNAVIPADSGKAKRDWDVWLQPTILKFVEHKTSTVTKKELEYVSLPFFLDEWFWISIGELALVILTIIFAGG